MAWEAIRQGVASQGPSPFADSTATLRSPSLQCLLDSDPELAEAVDPDARRVARAAATTLMFESDAGDLRLGDWLQRADTGPGLLVIDGVLAVNMRVGDRIAAELVGAGDLLQAPPPAEDELLPCVVGWRALVPVRFAVLDEAFANRTRFWPSISSSLLQRACGRSSHLNTQRAIAAQPRLEVRLALLLWHLAARWGKVEPGGIRLAVPLTHQLLGRLVGAERPSVSHALARLSHAGLVTGHSDEWHLHGSLDRHLASMLDADYRRLERHPTLSPAFGPA